MFTEEAYNEAFKCKRVKQKRKRIQAKSDLAFDKVFQKERILQEQRDKRQKQSHRIVAEDSVF